MVVASGRTDDDTVTAWLAESRDTTRSWDDCFESGEELMTLDVKLATALLAFFKDDKAHVTETSQRIFLLIDEQMDTTGKVARGRQVLNLLWHNLTSGIYVTTAVTWQTLAGVQLIGNNLTDFNHRWYKVLKEIRTRPDDLSLVEMLVKQLMKSSVLADDMTYFENLPINHQDNT